MRRISNRRIPIHWNISISTITHNPQAVIRFYLNLQEGSIEERSKHTSQSAQHRAGCIWIYNQKRSDHTVAPPFFNQREAYSQPPFEAAFARQMIATSRLIDVPPTELLTVTRPALCFEQVIVALLPSTVNVSPNLSFTASPHLQHTRKCSNIPVIFRTAKSVVGLSWLDRDRRSTPYSISIL